MSSTPEMTAVCTGAMKPASGLSGIIGGETVSTFVGIMVLLVATELGIDLLINDDVDNLALSSLGESFSQTFLTDSNFALSSSVPELCEIGAGSGADNEFT